MSEPRVAVVGGNFDSVVDGVALTLQRQVGFLQARGVPVRVYVPTGPRVIPHAHPVVTMPSLAFPGTPYHFALRLSAAARADLKAFRPTVLHVTTPDLLGWSALRWANARRIPVLSTFFTHFSRYAKYYHLGLLEPIAWWFQRQFYRPCAEIHVPAASVAAELQSHGIRGPFVVSPFGVDLAHFSPDKRSQPWRDKHGIAADDVVVVFVGRLVWEKGLDLWANVVRRLEAAGVPHRSAIVGEGPADAALRERLPRTVFTGRLDQPELGTAFASADLFFFPSESETFGCVTAEALASGLAAVVADAPGSRDLVQHNATGLVCPANDEDAFFAAVAGLLTDATARRRLAAAGPERAAAFAWDRVLGQHLAHLHRLTAPGRASSCGTRPRTPPEFAG